MEKVMRRRTVWIMVLLEQWVFPHCQRRVCLPSKKGPPNGLGVQCQVPGWTVLALEGQKLGIKRVSTEYHQ